MKALRTLLASMMLLVCTLAINAQPMSYNAMRNNARFLTDRMAYTLGISDPYIIDDIYRINYDYICGVNDYLDDVALGYRYDDYMAVCDYRDYALRELLGDMLWGRLIGYDYFYRPIIFENYRWRFSIYAFDNFRDRYYCHVPVYFNDYRGGHFFGGMRPGVSRGPRPVDYHGGFRDGRRGMEVNNHMNGFREPNRGGVMTPNRTGDMRGNVNHNGNMGGNRNDNRNVNVNVNRNDNHNVNVNVNRNDNRNDNRGGNMNGNMNGNRGGNMNGNRSGETRTERPNTTVRTERPTTTERPSSATRGRTDGPTRSGNVSTPSRSGNVGGNVVGGSRGGNMGGGSRGGNVGGGSRGGNMGGGSRGGSVQGGRR